MSQPLELPPTSPEPRPATGRPTKTRKHPLPRRVLAIVWDVHTAAGVLAAPFLLVIFVTAIFMPIHEELLVWGDPFLRAGAAETGLAHVLDGVGPEAMEHVDLHFASSAPGMIEVTQHVQGGEERAAVWVDGSTGEARPPSSHVVHDLYLLHFFYQVPGGIYVAGVFGLVLSLSLLTGLLAHLRDLVTRFGRLRTTPERARRSDWHTLLGTLLLIPATILAVTGTMLCLAQALALSHAYTTFEGEQTEVMRQMGYDAPAASGAPTPGAVAGVDLDEVLRRARDELPGLDPHWVRVDHPGADDALVRVYGHVEGVPRLAGEVDVALPSLDALRVSHQRTDGPTSAINRWGTALHFGNWGGTLIQALYVALALALTALAGWGLALWRARNTRGWFARAVEVLAVASSAGLLFGLSAGLAATQVLPLLLSDSLTAQSIVLFVGWLVTVPVAWLLPARRALQVLLFSSSLLLGVGVLVSLTPAGGSSLAGLGGGRGVLLLVDGVLLLFGAGFATLGWRVGRGVVA